MLLTELFDTKTQITVTEKEPDRCTMTFTVGDHDYKFTARQNDNVEEEGEWWEIAFGLRLKSSSRTEYDITGTGGALPVLATVTQCIQKLLTMYPKIDSLTFSAKTSEPSRVKLYNRMISSIKIPGWRAAREPGTRNDLYYLFKG